MPHYARSHPIESPDLVVPDVFEFGNAVGQPLPWMVPTRSFLVNGHVVSFDNVDCSDLISRSDGDLHLHRLPTVFSIYYFSSNSVNAISVNL